MCSAVAYKLRILSSPFRCETLVCDILLYLILSRPHHRWASCLLRPSERLVRHWSWVWVTSNTTCHGAIALPPKDQSNGVCSAAAYKPKTLPSLFQCGLLSMAYRTTNLKPLRQACKTNINFWSSPWSVEPSLLCRWSLELELALGTTML